MLRFQPVASSVDISFWQALARRKLEVLMLDSAPQSIRASMGPPTRADAPGRVSLSGAAFDGDAFAPPAGHAAVPGTLHLVNTMAAFKTLDKAALLREHGARTEAAVRAGDLSALFSFVLLVYADLKKHTFVYWFAFPALVTSARETAAPEPFLPELDLSPAGGAPFFLVVGSEVRPLGARPVEGEGEGEAKLGFVDPGNLPAHPGWPLRNLLFAARAAWGLEAAEVVAYRRVAGAAASPCGSLLLRVAVDAIGDDEAVKTVGWEANAQGKLAPRRVNLSSSMDPARLAEASVDLNLKLMRWRLLPSLDTDKLAATKCLLLGAGTLGCSVARCLLGWGVRTLTFVDNGTVSYSNPVRQSLFTFEDCEQQRPKAEAAAAAVRRIFPAVQARGLAFTIPMPGHPMGSTAEADAARAAVDQLAALISEHDVVFLLLDTREARWLPTLMGLAADKVVLDAALGLDQFVVLRHGARGGQAGGPSLGCYFCNDVVAPTDSTRDRTLDQQCTVTRPGLAPMASAVAVELMVGLLHHEHGHRAPADAPTPVNEPVEAALGLLPHQVRGYLTHFQNVVALGHAYGNCTACSDAVLAAFEAEGFAFLARVFDDPAYLETVTGLADMRAAMEEVDVSWSSDESDEDGLEEAKE